MGLTDILSAEARRVLYAVYAFLGLGLGATQVAYSAAAAGQQAPQGGGGAEALLLPLPLIGARGWVRTRLDRHRLLFLSFYRMTEFATNLFRHAPYIDLVHIDLC